MSAQDDYNAHKAAIDAKAGEYLDAAKAAYQALKNCGAANPAKLALVRAAIVACVGVMNWLCNAFNNCAEDVPGVQPLSGGGPKRNDDPDAP